VAEGLLRKLVGTLEFGFELSWPSSVPPDLAGLGWADLVLWFGGWPLWRQDGARPAPVRWTWLDLVEHLAKAWPSLHFEEAAPFGLVAQGPEGLRTQTLLRSVVGHTEEEVERAVHQFQHRHDLAAGLKGISLPPLWIVPRGRYVQLRAEGTELLLPAQRVFGVLEDFVSQILEDAPVQASERRQAAARGWQAREAVTELRAWRLRTGLPESSYAEWVPEGQDAAIWWGQPLRADSPRMAAARLTAGLPEASRRSVLQSVAAVGPSATAPLDLLAAEAQRVLDTHKRERPYEQGYAIAMWLRETLSCPAGPLDPEELLTRWGVEVASLACDVAPALDAVACWGEGCGPAVLVNPQGLHAKGRSGRRATLAHEIAHLLLDRGRELSVFEALGGSTPLSLEQRARAFAAELLLPREEAGRKLAWADNLSAAAASLRAEFGVSQQVLGWQLRNGTGWRLLGDAEKRTVRGWCGQWRLALGA